MKLIQHDSESAIRVRWKKEKLFYSEKIERTGIRDKVYYVLLRQNIVSESKKEKGIITSSELVITSHNIVGTAVSQKSIRFIRKAFPSIHKTKRV